MIFSYIIILTCIWWVVFFMVLPFGNQINSAPELGHADSAPSNPRLGLKITITSIIAIILSYGVAYSIEHGHFMRFIEKYLNWLQKL